MGFAPSEYLPRERYRRISAAMSPPAVSSRDGTFCRNKRPDSRAAASGPLPFPESLATEVGLVLEPLVYSRGVRPF
jgi:hypothetical protein